MDIIKLYTKKQKNPQYFILKKVESEQFLVNYPTYKPERFRMARWFSTSEVEVVWIKSFIGD